jgi:hypothetical protein
LRTLFLPLLAAACFISAAAPALAQPMHPEAIHAISDLRAARDLLSRGGRHGVSPEDQQAIGLIDQVIHSASRVALYDGRELHVVEQPGVDASASSPSRLENVHILLAAAAHDLNGTEENPTTRPYLDQARRQLGEALQIIRQEQQTHRY